MRFAKPLIALFFSAGAFLPSPLLAQQQDEQPPKDTTAQSRAREFRKLAASVVTAVPDSTTIEAAQFDSLVGTDMATTLRSAGITKVSRSGNHYRVELSKDFEFDVKSIHVKLKPVLEFDFSQDQDALTFTNIKGVEVTKMRFLRHSDLKNFTLSEDPAANIVVNAFVKVFGFISRNVEVKIGPDGKAVVK
jgi:hypothetical protein